MAKDVIIACDFPDAETTYDFLKRFKDRKPFVKIGMELFYSEGPDIVRKIKALGHKVFVDLKLHDIPNTVRGGMRSLSSLGADMVNVHASGGTAMMEAALEGLTAGGGERPVIIAVTVLTSTDAARLRDEALVGEPLENTVDHYASLAARAGLDGVVCSPLEAKRVKSVCGESFLTVTPGIRFADGNSDDQKRIATPEFARENGSDYIVVGRAVTGAADPVAAYERCIAGFIG